MALDLTVVRDNLGYLLVGRAAQGEPGGLLLTVLLSVAAGALALVFGVALALAAWAFGGWTRRLLFLWSDLIRAVPLVLVIFWLFFLLPAVFGETPGWLTVVLALAWFSAASVMHSTLAGCRPCRGPRPRRPWRRGCRALRPWLWCCCRRRRPTSPPR